MFSKGRIRSGLFAEAYSSSDHGRRAVFVLLGKYEFTGMDLSVDQGHGSAGCLDSAGGGWVTHAERNEQ